MEMNRKLLPVVAAFMILAIVLGTTPLTQAALLPTIGPNLVVQTIPQDDQKRNTGIMILGLSKNAAGVSVIPATWLGTYPVEVEAQYKLLVTYNGQILTWTVGSPSIVITCNVLEKDKVNVINDPKTNKGQQFSQENLMTKLSDVSKNFVCKPRWKNLTVGTQASVGVLDVYFTGTPKIAWIADHIITVQAALTIGRTVIFGVDIQDVCLLGYALAEGSLNAATSFVGVMTKPDGTVHYLWPDPLGAFAGCEDAAVYERNVLGVALPQGIDPLAPT